MDDASDIPEQGDLMLRELASLSLALARDMQQRAAETEDRDAAARLTLAFTQAARSLRQSLALLARLQRDRVRLAREERISAQVERDERIDRRRNATRTAAKGEFAPGRGLAERISLDIAVDERLREYAVLDEDFPDLPIETLIARLRRDLGLAAARADQADGGHADEAARPFKPDIPDRAEFARAAAALAPSALAVLAEAGRTRQPP